MMQGPFPSSSGGLSGTVVSIDLSSILKAEAAKARMNENDLRTQIKLLELKKAENTVESEMRKSLETSAQAQANMARRYEASQGLIAAGIDPAALAGAAGRRYRALFAGLQSAASGPSIKPNLGGFTTADDGGYGGVKASMGQFGLGGIGSQLSGSTTTGPANWKQRIGEIAKSKYTGPVVEAVLGSAVLGLAESAFNNNRAVGNRAYGLSAAANMSASSNLGSSIQNAEVDRMIASTVKAIPIFGGLADAIMGLSAKAEQSIKFLQTAQSGLASSYGGMYDASSRYASATGRPLAGLRFQQKQEYSESTAKVKSAQELLKAARSGGDEDEIALAQSALLQAQTARSVLGKAQAAEFAQKQFAVFAQAGGLGASAQANRALLAGDTVGAFQANAKSQTFGMMGQMAGQEPAIQAMAKANLESSLRVQAFQAAFATPQATGGVGGISEAMRSAYYMKSAGAIGDQAVADMNNQLVAGYPGNGQDAVLSINMAVQRIADALSTGTVRIEHQ